MNNRNPYKENVAKSEMLLAFALFLEKGIKAVERVYPQHLDFVNENSKKSIAEVKRELLSPVIA